MGDKYKSRVEWDSMSDANMFLSGVMTKTTVNRPVLSRTIRMETASAIIGSTNFGRGTKVSLGQALHKVGKQAGKHLLKS